MQKAAHSTKLFSPSTRGTRVSCLIPPPTYAARRKGTQRLRCSMGRSSRRGSLKAAFRWWYQDAPLASHDRTLTLTCAEDDSNVENSCVFSANPNRGGARDLSRRNVS